MLVFRTHSYYLVTCAPGVGQLAVQQIPQTYTGECVHWKREEEDVLHWENAEYSILFLRTTFHFLEDPKFSEAAEGKWGDAELTQSSFWHWTMSNLCTRFSLPALPVQEVNLPTRLCNIQQLSGSLITTGKSYCSLWKSAVSGNRSSRGKTRLMLGMIKGNFRQGSAVSSTIPGSVGGSTFL